jgi:diguanylate cyclase (GGDEF)-like protein
LNPIPINRADLESANTPPDALLKIRHTLVDRIWRGLAVVALLGGPASVLRSLSTGWMALYSVHIGLALVVLAVYWFRTRISVAVKSALLVLVLASVGLVGVFTLGVLGTGYWYLVLCSLLVSTLYSMRAGIASAVAVTALLAVAGVGFVSGVLRVPVDANAYIVSTGAWAALVFGTIVAPFVVFQAIAAYQQTTFDLLDEVHMQRDKIQELATHDQLTGLPSLSLASDRLEIALAAARRSGKKVALLFIDLDGFKTVNDTLGHEAGDFVLKEVAERLKKTIRPEDTAARIGGDEFILMLGGLPDEQVAARIAGRAIDAIALPIDCAGISISIGASIGIGLFPDHANDAQALRRVADVAMYTVKRGGKNRFAFANAEREQASTRATDVVGARSLTDDLAEKIVA